MIGPDDNTQVGDSGIYGGGSTMKAARAAGWLRGFEIRVQRDNNAAGHGADAKAKCKY
jgi:hypothetical protein